MDGASDVGAHGGGARGFGARGAHGEASGSGANCVFSLSAPDRNFPGCYFGGYGVAPA